MRWAYSFMIATLLLIPILTQADEPPAIPNYLSIGTTGNPLAVVPKLQVTFRNNAVEPVGLALEATINGEVVAQPDVSLHVQCVANRPDWGCELGWWQNPDWGQYVIPDNATHAFQWDDVQYGSEYCFRIRVFAPNDPATENWSKQTCKRIPPKPSVPAAPVAASDKFTLAEEQLTWLQRDFATIAAYTMETSDADLNQWHPIDAPAYVNHGSESQQASIPLSGVPSPFKAKPDYRVCATNVSGKTCSIAHRETVASAEPPAAASTSPPASKVVPASAYDEVATDHSATASIYAAASKPAPVALGRVKEPPKALGRVRTGTALDPSKTMCDYARSAKARNSPAAPALEKRCLEGGGSMTLPPPPAPVAAPDLDALAAVGAKIAGQDPAVAEARAAEASAFYQLGFDIASGIFGDPVQGALGNTLMGPGSEEIRATLSAAGQRGFDASVKFHQARNYKH